MSPAHLVRTLPAAATLAICAAASVLAAQGAYLLRDLRTAPTQVPRSGSGPAHFTALGAGAVFTAHRSGVGRELFWTDGTAAGTVLLGDLHAGAADSAPRHLTSLGGVCYFSAESAATGRELWKTDGTAAGTVLLKDIVPGPTGSNPHGFAALGGAVYFLLGDGSYDLWKTDGTAVGTVLVKVLGTAGSAERDVRMAAAGGRLYFGAPALYTSDGTAAGTAPLPGAIVPTEMVALGADAFATDGTVFVRCTASGAAQMTSSPWGISGLVAAGAHVYFRRTDVNYSGGFPNYYTWLWRADASAASAFVAANASLLGVVGNAVYFSAPMAGGITVYRDFAVHVSIPGDRVLAFHLGDVYWTAGARLYRFDAARAATLDLGQHLGPLAPAPLWPGLASGVLLFPADNSALGNEPHRTDGSVAGTFVLGDLDPTLPGGDTESSDPQAFHDAAGLVYFSAVGDGIGRELFVSDGSGAGTRLVADLEPGPTGSNPRHFTSLGGEVLFAASVNGLDGVWSTDGTTAGTRLLGNVRDPANLTTAGAFVFFRGSSGPHELWRTDGTPAGTVFLQSLGSLYSNPIQAVGNAVFFPVANAGLWRVEGAGPPGQVVAGVVPADQLAVGDHLYFTAVARTTASFWRVHASGSNAAWLADLAPAGGLYAEFPHAAHGLVFCWSLVGTTRSAFATNGTQVGTYRLPVTGSGPYLGSKFGSVAGRTIVRTPGELFLSDGTPSNTVPLRRIWSRPGPSTNMNRSNYAVSAGARKVYFAENDGWGGLEVWVTDGTAAGTRQVSDTYAGAYDGQYSFLAAPVVSNGRLVFAGQDAHHGGEPWAVDVGAIAQRVGSGCAARTLPPSLSADDPILGTPIDIRLEWAGPLQAGVLVLGAPSAGFRHAHFGLGCTLYLAPAAPVVVPFATDAAGTFRLSGVGVPNLPSLGGMRLMLQAGTGPASAMPLGVDLSNGVLLVLGTS